MSSKNQGWLTTAFCVRKTVFGVRCFVRSPERVQIWTVFVSERVRWCVRVRQRSCSCSCGPLRSAFVFVFGPDLGACSCSRSCSCTCSRSCSRSLVYCNYLGKVPNFPLNMVQTHSFIKSERVHFDLAVAFSQLHAAFQHVEVCVECWLHVALQHVQDFLNIVGSTGLWPGGDTRWSWGDIRGLEVIYGGHEVIYAGFEVIYAVWRWYTAATRWYTVVLRWYTRSGGDALRPRGDIHWSWGDIRGLEVIYGGHKVIYAVFGATDAGWRWYLPDFELFGVFFVFLWTFQTFSWTFQDFQVRPVRFPYAANFVKRRNINKTNAFSTISSRTIPVRNRTPSRALPYDSRTLLQRAEMTVKPMLFQRFWIFGTQLPYDSRTISAGFWFFLSCFICFMDFISIS